jgi:hypothetical protein
METRETKENADKASRKAGYALRRLTRIEKKIDNLTEIQEKILKIEQEKEMRRLVKK